MSETENRQQDGNARLVGRLLLIVVAMFGFGFALVPLYDLFCEVTGLNGKTNTEAYIPLTEQVDRNRTVKVQFLTTNNEGMPWEFKPQVFEMSVHPGEEIRTTFYARNPQNNMMVAQAIPSVAPGKAAAYFHKTECFCFNRQELNAGEDIDMPVSFIVDIDLPESVKVITLSYTLFDVTDKQGFEEPDSEEISDSSKDTHANQLAVLGFN